MNSFNRGAASPLSFIWCPGLTLAAGLLLGACSHNAAIPPFTASGYAADQGAVRIWRKDSDDGAVHLFTAFSPWRNGDTSTSDYHWQNERLASIEINVYGKQTESIKARFDDRGGLSFMQRDINGQKQQLSSDQIALYQYRAEQLHSTSNALREGRVVLRQGRWHANRTITTCEGQTVSPELDALALSHIERRQNHSSADVSVAWLESPDGAQLLLVANEDFCSWQPKPDAF